jgi:hypothetical protein
MDSEFRDAGVNDTDWKKERKRRREGEEEWA